MSQCIRYKKGEASIRRTQMFTLWGLLLHSFLCSYGRGLAGRPDAAHAPVKDSPALGIGSRRHLPPFSICWLCYGGDVNMDYHEVELVKHLGLTVNHTGSDVRLSTGEVVGKKATAHASSRALWWQWKHLFKVKWSLESHINFLEMRTVLLTLLWKCRDSTKVNKRWLHLEDSMVSLFIYFEQRAK